jgi:hypothetical protein
MDENKIKEQIIDNAFSQMGLHCGKHMLSGTSDDLLILHSIASDLLTEIIDSEVLNDNTQQLSCTVRLFHNMIRIAHYSK